MMGVAAITLSQIDKTWVTVVEIKLSKPEIVLRKKKPPWGSTQKNKLKETIFQYLTDGTAPSAPHKSGAIYACWWPPQNYVQIVSNWTTDTVASRRFWSNAWEETNLQLLNRTRVTQNPTNTKFLNFSRMLWWVWIKRLQIRQCDTSLKICILTRNRDYRLY